MKWLPFMSCMFLLGCIGSKPSAEVLAKADYGTYPSDYKEIVSKWIFATFYDPHSVQDLVITEPKKGYHSQGLVDGGGTTFGYEVAIGLRAKNQLGGYTGAHFYSLLIRNGEVVYQSEYYGK